MLKLEKENQSLLRTIEDLRAASLNNNTQPKHSNHHNCDHVCQVVYSANNCTSSTDKLTGLQTSSLNIENHTDVSPLSTITQQMPNGDSKCHHEEESEILLTDNSHLHIQEKGQLEGGDSGDHLKELMSDLEVLENHHNRHHCFVGSRDHSPGSKSSSPCHDSIFTGLPTRSSYASKHTQRLEAKCRALDTVNQHLQISLDNTGRCYTLQWCLQIISNTLTGSTFIYFSVFYVFRPKSPASGGRGSGARGREPESTGHLGGTSDLCKTPGTTGDREAESGTRDHSPGEGQEAAGERESTTPSAGRYSRPVF